MGVVNWAVNETAPFWFEEVTEPTNLVRSGVVKSVIVTVGTVEFKKTLLILRVERKSAGVLRSLMSWLK
jgi:hypothetical protein